MSDTDDVLIEGDLIKSDDIELPDIEALEAEIQAAEAADGELSDIELPDIELPDIELPDIDLPAEPAEKTVIAEAEPEIPEVPEIPDIPDIVMPEDNVPEPVIEEPVIEEPVIEEPVIEEPVIEEPVVEEPVIEEPVVEEPMIEEPVIEEPVVEEPVIEEPVIEEPVIEEPVIEEPVIEEPVIEEPVIEEPVIEEPVIEEPVVEEPVIEEPVVEEPAAEIPDMEIPDIEIPDEETAMAVIEEAEAAAAENEIADIDIPIDDIPNMDGLDNIEFIKTESADTEQLEKSLENINSAADLVAHDDNSIMDKMLLSQPEEHHDDDMMSEAEMDALLAAFDKKEEKKREKAEEAEMEAILNRIQDEDVKAAINDTLAEVSPEMMEETLSEISGIDEQPEESAPEEPELTEQAAEEALPEEATVEESTPEESIPEESTPEESAAEEPVSDEALLEELLSDESIQEELLSAEEPDAGSPVEEPELPDIDMEAAPDTAAEGEPESEAADDGIMSEEQVDELLKSIEEMGDPTNTSTPEEAELSDIIAGSDDADIAEIGELLDKNDNFEAVDSSLMDNDQPDDIPMPDLDDILSGGEGEGEAELSPKEKKRREKQAKKEQKKKEKEAKKNKKAGKEPAPVVDAGGAGEFELPSEDDEAFKADMDEALAGMTFTDVPEEYDGVDLEVVEKGDEAASRKKKNGFFAKLIRTLTEPVDGEDEEELAELTQEVFAEETAKDIAKAGAEDNEQILKEMEGEEEPEDGKGKKGKKGKKEKKEKKVKEKKPKKEKQKDKELFKMPKLPKKRVALIMLCTLSLGVLIGVASMVLPYYTDIKDAHASYENGDYKSTFMSLTGHKLNAEQQELYNKNLILYKLQQKLKSYRNYLKLGMMPDALNALVQGIKDVDELGADAEQYGITDQFNAYAGEITYELDSTFGVSAEQARSWLELEDSREYTRALYEYIGPSQAGEVAEPSGDVTTTVPQGTSNSVIEGEEAEFENEQ